MTNQNSKSISIVLGQMREQQLKHIKSDSRGKRMGSKCGKRCKKPQKNAWSSATVNPLVDDAEIAWNKHVPNYVSVRDIMKGNQPYWCIMMHIPHGYNEVSFICSKSVCPTSGESEVSLYVPPSTLFVFTPLLWYGHSLVLSKSGWCVARKTMIHTSRIVATLWGGAPEV